MVLPPTIAFVAVPAKSAAGQADTVYLLPAAVMAVRAMDRGNCRVLLSPGVDWIEIDMDAPVFITSIGGMI